MLQRIRRQLTFANVTALLALFIALGGSSYAVSRINGARIRDHSIAGEKLKRNTLGRATINEARLGKVPRARRSDSARVAQSAASLDDNTRSGGAPLRASDLTLRCPSGTGELVTAGVCFEPSAREPLSHINAINKCGERRRRMPSYHELLVAEIRGVVQIVPGEQVANVYPSSTLADDVDFLFFKGFGRDVGTAPNNEQNKKAFRCVAPPSNAGVLEPP